MITCDCSCDEGEGPRCYRKATRKARKAHKCIECGREIPRGAKYEDIHGIGYEGESFDNRTCLSCVAIRKRYCPNGWIMGGLAEQIEPCIGFDYRLPTSEIPDEDGE